MISAAFSPIIIQGALVLPEIADGMIEASATRSPLIPFTLHTEIKKLYTCMYTRHTQHLEKKRVLIKFSFKTNIISKVI